MLINTFTAELPDPISAAVSDTDLEKRPHRALAQPPVGPPAAAKKWCAPAVIERDQLTIDLAPQVAVNAHGEAFAIWRQLEDGRSRLWVNRCQRGQGWGVAQPLDTGVEQGLGYPQIGVDAEGNACKFAYVANFRSNNVSAYTMNSTTGALTPVPGSPFAACTNPNSIVVTQPR